MLDLSIVIPCLNEDETLSICISKCKSVIQDNKLSAEIIIADNGSNDNSISIANKHGVKVVNVDDKGYGFALMGGIDAAQGKYILMADADDSYDFLEIPKFLNKIREGYDLVQGCRLPSGGGNIKNGAMPKLHQYFGNPFLTFLSRIFFSVPVNDIYCGMRCFKKEMYLDIQQKCGGMEFATENIIKSSLHGYKITEVPITLYKDGRAKKIPHLRTFKDGWRTLRFFLLYCPKYLYVYPGFCLLFIGFLGFLCGLFNLNFLGVTLDAHTLVFSSLSVIIGFQSLLFGLLTYQFSANEGLYFINDVFKKLNKFFTLEKSILIALLFIVIGIFSLGYSINKWRLLSFGEFSYSENMKIIVPGVTVTAIGFQLIMYSFYTNILNIPRKAVSKRY